MDDSPLEEFGSQFVVEVRNATLGFFDQLLDGSMRAPVHLLLIAEIAATSPETRSLLQRLAVTLVDHQLHDTLRFFEESDGWAIAGRNNGVTDLADESDGLSGELYSEDGWINLYGRPGDPRYSAVSD